MLTQHVLADGCEQQLWHILHDVNSLLFDEDQFFWLFYLQMTHRVRLDMTSAFGVNLKHGGYAICESFHYVTTTAGCCERWY